MTFSRGARAAATRVGLAVLTVLATSAAPPPDNPTPRQCLDAWDAAPAIDYVGDGWPGALVAGPPNWWVYSPLDITDRDFSLYCGDESSGVVHIGGDRSTGSGHPITKADQDWFIGCWNAVIGSGTATDDGEGRTKFTLVRWRTKSVAYVDNARRFTYSLYTSGDSWHDCYLAWVTG